MSLLLGLSALTGVAEGVRNVQKMKYEEQKEADEKAAEKQALQDKWDHEIALAKAREEAKAKAKANIEAQKAKADKQKEIDLATKFRTAYSVMPTTTSIESIAEATGATGLLNPDAEFRVRVPVRDGNGEYKYFGNENQYMEMDLIQIEGSSQSGIQGANDQLTKYMTRVDKGTLDWMEKNNPSRYATFTSNIQNNVVTIAQESAPDIQVGNQVMKGEPRLPVATAVALAKNYGPKFAEDMIKAAMPQIALEVRDAYPQIYGVELAKGTEGGEKVVEKTVAGPDGTEEKVLTVEPADGSVYVTDVDMPDGKKNPEANIPLKQLADDHGITQNLVNQNFNQVTQKYDHLNGQRLLNRVVEVRSKFAENQLSFSQRGSTELFDPYDKFSMDMDNFVNEFGLFTKMDAADSLTVLSFLAPPGLTSGLEKDTKIRPVSEGGYTGAAALGQQKAEDAMKAFNDYLLGKYGKRIGGTFEDVSNKSMAASDGVLVLDGLIALSENKDIPVGIAAEFVTMANGARAQLSLFANTIEKIGGNPEQVKFLRDNANALGASRDALQTMDAGVRLKEYYKGVLVYQMALALQGGNAAARTVSDADIERIQQIVGVLDRLVDPKAQVAVFRAIRRKLDRQARIGEAITSGTESRVWAGITAHSLVHRNSSQTQSDILYALENEVASIERQYTGGGYQDSTQPEVKVKELNGIYYESDGKGGWKVIPPPTA